MGRVPRSWSIVLHPQAKLTCDHLDPHSDQSPASLGYGTVQDSVFNQWLQAQGRYLLLQECGWAVDRKAQPFAKPCRLHLQIRLHHRELIA
jgi:hypothetical protein